MEFGIFRFLDLCPFGIGVVAPYKKDVLIEKTCTDAKHPIWTAPEALMDEDRGGEYSEASDVWSFGVVLYELIHSRPPCADDFDTDESRRQFDTRIAQMIITTGYAHLAFPQNSTDIFNQLMRRFIWIFLHIKYFFRCWKMEPMERPKFWQINHDLAKLTKIGLKITSLDETTNNSIRS